MKFPWCFYKVSSGLQKVFGVESIPRVFQETFEGVSGVFSRVFEASSKVVCQRSYGSPWKFEGVSKNFRGVLGQFHGCHREISRVFQECFTSDSSLSSQFQGEIQREFQGSFIKVSRIFQRSVKDLS